MEGLYKKLGENVRQQRLRQGLTQQSLAESAGIHYTFLGHIERGNKSPSIPTLARLAHALRTSPSSLLKGLGQN